jgi:hypothetical protein
LILHTDEGSPSLPIAAAFQRFDNSPFWVDDFTEISLSMEEKMGVGKVNLSIDNLEKAG